MISKNMMSSNKIPFEKSFASHEKSEYWSDKNKIKPNEISKGSEKKFYFNCNKCKHEFLMRINVVTKGGWCSICSGHKICLNNDCVKCFEKSFASHEKSKYWSSKNEDTPRKVFKSSASKYLFNCNKCNHEFSSSLDHVSRNRWCPYCCVPQKQLCGNLNCNECFEKSFASHEKVKNWSDKNKLKPEFVMKNGDKKIWFNCANCNHDFEKEIKRITQGEFCPYCVNKKICDINDCKYCFNKSFASHEKSKYWSNKNKENPREVSNGNGEKYWFNCNKCKHEFEKTICSITGNKNSWCPYCANKKMCLEDNCIDCFNKSFASHNKAKFWSSKNKENPRHLFQGDSNKYWFYCEKCDIEFESIMYNIKNGNWCPFCNNKTEGKFYKIMKEIYPLIIYQFRVEWCKNISYLPFDFCIPEHNIIIEIDGPQHFKQIMNWKTPEEQFENDKYKEKCANDNGYSIIRLLQDDIFNDKYNWVKELCKTIEEIKNGDEIVNIYLYKNEEYDKY